MHSFTFNSGTTLIYRMLGQHQDISSITGPFISFVFRHPAPAHPCSFYFSWSPDSPAPEDEGQHLQSTYQRVYQLGSMRTWAHNPRAHMAEDDPAATTATAQVGPATISFLVCFSSPSTRLSSPVLSRFFSHPVFCRFTSFTGPNFRLGAVLGSLAQSPGGEVAATHLDGPLLPKSLHARAQLLCHDSQTPAGCLSLHALHSALQPAGQFSQSLVDHV